MVKTLKALVLVTALLFVGIAAACIGQVMALGFTAWQAQMAQELTAYGVNL